MIKVKHPVEECNISQEKLLAACPAEERRYHELVFTVGNISYRYHHEAREYSPNLEDYQEWLEGLPENVRRGMEQLGFEGCRNVLSFTRYVMEKHDVGMEEYTMQHMGAEDYAAYQVIAKA
ncbi:hypothetical protein [Pontibacter actiniarum]|uniref:Uncharacterized protein n=1 Tax=Pontibacter actiniarum TaxID=323450 RepID=A0A1X9YYW9_9BACT|nr:hypothetical protein [Pontibacter actiniarum]ARS38069.1 hypothetical protein CA264_21205 [Pontibacter actiniarum]